ncbi:MAG: multi-copper polyphenol oxidoreductase, partial [Halothiobacillus sp. 14-56-357]
RGLAAGVLESTLARFRASPESIQAWMGPAIGPEQFEVGEEVRSAFMAVLPEAKTAFVAKGEAGKYLADLPALARQRLMRAGLKRISGGNLCTVRSPDLFYSYRRDGGRTGRMATLIWRDAH